MPKTARFLEKLASFGRGLPGMMKAGLVLGIIFNAYSNLNFLQEHNPSEPAYENRMTIDARTFVLSGAKMSDSNDLLFTRDTYHSAGMQVLVANLFHFVAADPLVVKTFNFMLWGALLLLVFAFQKRVLKSESWALLSTFLVSFSIPLQRYCAIVQYEIFVSCGLAALLFLNSGRPSAVKAFTSGFVIALLGIFRFHFTILLLPALWACILAAGDRKSSLRSGLALFSGFLLISFPWNLYYSVRLGEGFLFHSVQGDDLRRSLNPAVVGWSYPNFEAAEPSGLRFIWALPWEYLKLLGRRAQFLTGYMPDVWFIESRWTEIISRVLPLEVARTLVVFFSGAWVAVGASALLKRRPPAPSTALLIGIPAILLVPHFIINSSSRYLIPAIPVFVAVQVYGMKMLMEKTTQAST